MGWNPFKRDEHAGPNDELVDDSKTRKQADKASRAVAKSGARDLKKAEARFAGRLDGFNSLPQPPMSGPNRASPASPISASPHKLSASSGPNMNDFYPGSLIPPPPPPMLDFPSFEPPYNRPVPPPQGSFNPGELVPGSLVPGGLVPGSLATHRQPSKSLSSGMTVPSLPPIGSNRVGGTNLEAARSTSSMGPSRRNSGFMDYVRNRTAGSTSDYKSRWDPAQRSSTITSGSSLPALDLGGTLTGQPREEGDPLAGLPGSVPPERSYSSPGQPSASLSPAGISPAATAAASTEALAATTSNNSSTSGIHAEISSLRTHIAQLRRSSQDLESLMSGTRLSTPLQSPNVQEFGQRVPDPGTFSTALVRSSPRPADSLAPPHRPSESFATTHRPSDSLVFQPNTRPPAEPTPLFSPPTGAAPLTSSRGAPNDAPRLPALPAIASVSDIDGSYGGGDPRVPVEPTLAPAPTAIVPVMPQFITPTAGPGSHAFAPPRNPDHPIPGPLAPPSEASGDDGVILPSASNLALTGTEASQSNLHLPPQLERPHKDWMAGDKYTPFPSEGRSGREMHKYLIASDSVEEAKTRSRKAGRLALYPDETALQNLDADLKRKALGSDYAKLSPEEQRMRLEQYRPHYAQDDVNPWSGVPRRAQQRGQERDARRAAAAAAAAQAAHPHRHGYAAPGAATPSPRSAAPSLYGVPPPGTPGGMMTPGGMTPGGMMTPGMAPGMMSPGNMGGMMPPGMFAPPGQYNQRKERGKTIAELEDRHKQRLAALQATAKESMLEREKGALLQAERDKVAQSAVDKAAREAAQAKEQAKSKHHRLGDPKWRQSAVGLLHRYGHNNSPRQSKSGEHQSPPTLQQSPGQPQPQVAQPVQPIAPVQADIAQPAAEQSTQPTQLVPPTQAGPNATKQDPAKRVSTMSFAQPGAPQSTPRQSMYGAPTMGMGPTPTPRQSVWMGNNATPRQSIFGPPGTLGENPTPRQSMHGPVAATGPSTPQAASPTRPNLQTSQSTPAVVQGAFAPFIPSAAAPEVPAVSKPKPKRELTETDLRRKAEMRGSQPLLSFEGPILQEARGRAEDAQKRQNRISTQMLQQHH